MTIGVVSVSVIYLGLFSECVHTGYVYLDFFYVASYVVYTGILHNNTLMWVFTDHTHTHQWSMHELILLVKQGMVHECSLCSGWSYTVYFMVDIFGEKLFKKVNFMVTAMAIWLLMQYDIIFDMWFNVTNDWLEQFVLSSVWEATTFGTYRKPVSVLAKEYYMLAHYTYILVHSPPCYKRSTGIMLRSLFWTKNYSLILKGCYDRTLRVMDLVTETKVEKESSERWCESYPNISLLNHKNWHTQKLPVIKTTIASFPTSLRQHVPYFFD